MPKFTKLEPLFDRVILKVVEAEQDESLLVIPDQAKEKPTQGQVIAVGPEADKGIAVDNVVLFSKYSGNEFELNKERLLIIRDDDVIGVLK